MNRSGYADPTAECAIGNVSKKGRKGYPKEVKALRKTLEGLAELQGYHIKELVLQDKTFGKEYR